MAGTAAGQEPADARPLEKGLKTGAISFASSVVIGVASTAPGYSLAAVLGLVVAVEGVGTQAPAIFIVAFIPMLLVAMAYKYLNKADPDAGTSFSWATRAFGPNTGWITGWAIVVADIIVMANLAQIAGLYSFLLFGIDDPSTLARDGHRRHLDRRHDLRLRHRHRARTPRRSSGCSRPRSSRWRSSPWSRLTRVWAAPPPRVGQPGALVVLAVRHRLDERADLRRPARGLHLLGLGQPRVRQRGDRGRRERPGQGRDRRDADPARHLRGRLDRRDRLRRPGQLANDDSATCSGSLANSVFGSICSARS